MIPPAQYFALILNRGQDIDNPKIQYPIKYENVNIDILEEAYPTNRDLINIASNT